jgi:hypothetical protein
MKKLFLVCALLVASSGTALADSVTLTPAELSNFTLVAITGGGTFNDTLPNGIYSAQWGVDGPQSATSNLTLGAARGVAGDVFTITVFNNNGNPWDFTVSINNGFAGTQSSGPFSIPNNGGNQTFSFVLGANGLQEVRITVAGVLPISGTDRGAEYQLAAVPEPTTLLLLGTGLVGVAGAFRRRFRNGQ